MSEAIVSRLVGIIEKQVADPLLGAISKPLSPLGTYSAGATTSWLAGKKTYILSALGVTSTLALAGVAAIQNGVSVDMVATTIAGLIGSTALATLRSAVANHAGQAAVTAFDIGEQVLMQLLQANKEATASTVAQVAAVVPDAPIATSTLDVGVVQNAFQSALTTVLAGYHVTPVAEPAASSTLVDANGAALGAH